MTRRAKLSLPEVPVHVVQRGNRLRPTFLADDDYAFYLECLKEAADRHSCDVHAYVLMTDHVHLLVTPHTPAAILRLMRSVGTRYVQHANYAHRRTGPLWEGRVKASLIDAEAYLLTCYRYIEENPVRAGLVSAPGEYRWSSYGWHALGSPDPVVRDHVLYMALGPTDAARRGAYQASFREPLEAGVVNQIRESLNHGAVLGTARFKESIERIFRWGVQISMRDRSRKLPAREHRFNSHGRSSRRLGLQK